MSFSTSIVKGAPLFRVRVRVRIITDISNGGNIVRDDSPVDIIVVVVVSTVITVITTTYYSHASVE